MKWGKKLSHSIGHGALFVFLLFLAVLLTGCAAPSPTERAPAYNIADYYHSDGAFSALALALEERDFGRQLDAVRGDRFVVENQAYEVLAASFSVVFYTHPSLDHATEWWIEYLETAMESGIVTIAE
ncbi:MAG: hypothetical protein FWE77_02390 [Clostridia bacterium]|nr:hypothetical protein [Clostridia bacterium]